MVNTKNVILDLPFDESDGSLTVHDYPANRTDGIVSDVKSVSSKIGNAIQSSGKGTYKISKNALDLLGEFSVLCWVNPMSAEVGSPSKAIRLLAFDDVGQYFEVPIELSRGNWVSVATTKREAQYNLYINTVFAKVINRSGTLLGVPLNQDYFGGEYGKGCADDTKLYNIALSREDLIEEISDIKRLTYYIDGVDLKEHGVYVSGSDGLTDRPRMKSSTPVSQDNYHGTCVDLNRKFYESREITLFCLIKAAEGKGDFASKMNRFFQIFDKTGTHRLVVDIHPTEPLVYEVYSGDAIVIKKAWGDSLMIGTFILKSKEPSPVKRVLKFIRVEESMQNRSIKITTTKLADIHRGDGEVQTDIYDKDLVVNYTFKSSGDYYIIITGCIDEIEKFETNVIVV